MVAMRTNGKFQSRMDEVVRWLNKREHPSYRYGERINKAIRYLFLTIISYIFMRIVYFNLSQVNTIKILFIQLGGFLLVASFVFFVYCSYKLIIEIFNWYLRQKHWIRYIILLLVLILFLIANGHKTTLFDTFISFYNSLDFKQISPFCKIVPT